MRINQPPLFSGAVVSGFIGDSSVLSGSIGSGQISTYHFSSGAVINNALTLNGTIWERYEEQQNTGLLYGGEISFLSGANTIIIASGLGVISTPRTGSSGTPESVYVSWGLTSGLTIPISSGNVTYVSVKSGGTFVTQNDSFTLPEYLDQITLGYVLHPNNVNVQEVHPHPSVSYACVSQLNSFARVFGPLKVSGLAISPNGANLQVNRAAGYAFAFGSNYTSNENNPSTSTENAKTTVDMYYIYRAAAAGQYTFTTSPVTNVDVANYDNGTGTLAAVTANQWTIQRVFYIPENTNNVYIYYGRATYGNSATASQNIFLEAFDEDSFTSASCVFLGYIISRGGASALNNTSDAIFIQAGNFRNSAGGGGGSGGLSLDDLTDVTLSASTESQVLTYSAGVWRNLYVTSGSISSGQIGVNHLISGLITTLALGSGQVNSGNIASGAVFNNNIASGGVISGKLADGSVNSGNISSGQVGLFHLASGTVFSGTFVGSGTVQSGSLGNASVVSGSIASGIIGSVHLADGAVLSGDVSSGQISNFHLSSGSATGNLLSGSVSNNQLANSAIAINGASTSLGGSYNNAALTISTGLTGGSYNGSGAVTIALASGAAVANLLSGSIGSGLLANNSVVSGSIASGQIGVNHLISGLITTLTLGSGQVTSGNIASGVVFRLLSGNITSGFIGDNAVVSGSIASGQVGQYHLSNNSVFSGHVSSSEIGSVHLNSGAAIGNLSSGSIKSGGWILGDGVVQSGNIASGLLSNFTISSGSITSGLIGNAAVVSGSIASGNVGKYSLTSGLVPSFTISASTPSSPLYGDRWFDTNTGTLLTYLYDGATAQWVQ